MLPTRMYAKDAGGLYVDLFIGSAVTLEYVAGADVEVVQENGYPWDGSVGISINPAGRRTLSVRVRIPDRMVSRLNRAAPDANGITSRDHRDLRGRIGSAGDAELRAGDPGGGTYGPRRQERLADGSRPAPFPVTSVAWMEEG